MTAGATFGFAHRGGSADVEGIALDRDAVIDPRSRWTLRRVSPRYHRSGTTPMGTWGTSLYSDDTTCEVRDRYVDLLRDGLDAKRAIARILRNYRDEVYDRESNCLVTFALAHTAWRHGRLTDALRRRALKLLASGGDVPRWERDAPFYAPKRRKVLASLRARLESPQPPEKTIRRRRPSPPPRPTLDAKLGEVFLMPMPDGTFVPLVYMGRMDLGHTIDPYFMVPTWRKRRRPTLHEISEAAKHPASIPSGLPGPHYLVGFMALEDPPKAPHPTTLFERTSITLVPPPDVPSESPSFHASINGPAESLDKAVPARRSLGRSRRSP